MDKRYSLNQVRSDGGITMGNPKYRTLSDAKNAAHDTIAGHTAQVIEQWIHGQGQPARQWERYRVGSSWKGWREVAVKSISVVI